MGLIARECAKRFVALGCDVAHWSRTQRDAADAGGAPWLPLPDLLRRSDVLVVLVALAPETRGLLGVDQLALMPPGAFVINAARGGIVDEAAMLEAIHTGALAGAALDVYDTEPLPADSPLLGEDRVLLSPHAGGATREAQGRLITGLLENIRRAVASEAVINVVNRADLAGFEGLIRRREA
jgi:phosphoglycerate dehydrogenase-like enzyme